MLKKKLPLLALLLLSLPCQALATSIIQDYSNGSYNINYGKGQTFVATATSFTSISVYISLSPNPATVLVDPSIDFKLYEGSFDKGFTEQWIDEEINLSSLLPSGGTLNIDISSFTFTIGSKYTFALLNDTSYWSTSVANNGDDHYTQGSLCFIYNIDNEEKYYPTTINADLQFSVNTPIPEPSTILLLASGLSMLTLYRKKFLKK